ncbi:YdbH domain-containing protein [Alkalimonas sp. MEB108]|uniref:YdbH domain-containing protein n=1 Tax=Alkalimonas cellulosilytica TaxID=3058395 RepID=A0ABU7J4R3_9GAMM|nr:YdbH domain-containing protein [Alkalimonas sp. MEB108]MEE2001367.1 YdbH domain-containing protein [Alkalimonas sp. MEB108]
MRRFFRIFSLSLTLLLAVLLAVFLWLQHQLRQLPVQQLDYQISQWGFRQLHLQHLSFEYLLDNSPLRVEFKQLTLGWHWQNWRPQLNQLSLEQLAVRLEQLPVTAESEASPAMQLPTEWHLPDWLPAYNTIDQLLLDLPCGEQRCHYQGSLKLKLSDQLSAYGQLAPQHQPDSQLTLQLDYQLQQQWPDIRLQLQVTDLLQLQLLSSLQADQSDTTQAHWQGDMALELQPPPAWLLTELRQWQLVLPETWLQQFQQQVTANSQWQLLVPTQISSQPWQQLTGRMQLQLSSPSPLYLPEFGLITAELEANAEFEQGQLAPFRLAAGGTLTELQLPEPLTALGFKAEPLYWSLSSQHNEAFSLAALPLQFLVSSADRKQQLRAGFQLDLPAQQAVIEQLELQLTQPELSSGDWQLSDWQLSSSLSGMLSAQSMELVSTKPLQLQAIVQNPALELSLARMSLELDELRFSSSGQSSGPAPDIQQKPAHTEQGFMAKASVHATQLLHPAVKPLDWQWQGRLDANSSSDWQFAAEGELAASSGLEFQTTVQAGPEQLAFNWQLADVFLLAGNTLATTLTDWPELLTLQRGRIKHQGELIISQPDDRLKLTSSTELLDLAGFYDTTTFRGLSSQLQLTMEAEQLLLEIPRLTLQQFEQGVVGGPLQLAATYQATLTAPASGTLELFDNELVLFNGRVKLPPMTLDLAQQAWELPLHIHQLDLQQLLTQHPTSDLTGQGLINGRIPLLLSAQGIEVARGRLQAEEPGGRLSYRSPQAQGMAASNPGMKTIVAALDDFHYSVLSSDVSYSTDGHLTLALRLEGRNPAMEGGRPVHLNITLEENIPALITSLQLTNQLNEVIQKRVRERLQQPRQP